MRNTRSRTLVNDDRTSASSCTVVAVALVERIDDYNVCIWLSLWLNDGSSWVARDHDLDSEEEEALDDEKRHSILDSESGLNGETTRGRTQEAVVA